MESKFCVISILGDDNKSLKYYFISNNVVSEHHNVTPSINEGVIKKLLSQKKAVIINNIKQADIGELSKNHPIEKNLLFMPILNQDKIYGFVYYVDKFDESGFSQTDEEIATILAFDISIMIDHINRYRKDT